jgi:hypothetical protein
MNACRRSKYFLLDAGPVKMTQDAEQIENLLGGADAAGEHDDRVGHSHERLEPLLHVRQDHELVDDRVRGFGRDDRRLGEA